MLSVKRQAPTIDLQTNKRPQRSVPLEKSLEHCYPQLSLEWHPTKNGTLSAKDVSTGSHQKVYWLCSTKKGCQSDCCRPHEWEAEVKSRVNGNGCPLCSGRTVCVCRSLAFVNPTLASQWHPSKNGDIRPTDVSEFCNKAVWWLCSTKINCTSSCTALHEWKAPVANRTKGHGCPLCNGGRLECCPCRSLANEDKTLTAQWHPTKNGNLRPDNLSTSSGQKVWWLCEAKIGCAPGCTHVHEWQRSIDGRKNGKIGCPWCSSKGKVLCPCRSLAFTNNSFQRC